MINYLLAPLDKHYDLGFGFTGNTFRDAANALIEKNDEFYFGNPPISFLQRHAIELYLKSAIIILYKLEGNIVDSNSDDTFPKVKSSGKEKPLYKVHSVGVLFQHLRDNLKSSKIC